MFEDMTFDVIMKRMLGRVDNSIDKREGSIIYDALAPAAVELHLMYIELDTFLNEVFADTATREYLIRRAAERGISPDPASCAILKAEFTTTDIDVMGCRFNCDDMNYIVIEKLSDGIYRIQCETAGTEGNKSFGTLIPIDYINGLQTAKIVELLVPGEDEEDTEVFRQRYFDSLQSQAFGGNVADYKQKLLAIDGVGGVKVYRAAQWNGAGTVKLVIQDANFSKPTDGEGGLIEQLQEMIDPEMNHGEGLGIAPIGHQVTVVGVNEVAISIQADITYSEGYSFESVETLIKSTIDNYLKELNKTWGEVDKITVFLMQIGARLLNINGILDVTNLRINNNAGNISLERDEILCIEKCTINGKELGA